jgi:hypothetical protein
MDRLVEFRCKMAAACWSRSTRPQPRGLSDRLWVPTSSSSAPARAGCMWRSCWTPSPAGSSAGRWLITCTTSWSWTPSTWRSPSGSQRPADPSQRPRLPAQVQGVVALVASMGTVGDALDNAVAESFFTTLECELLDRYDWPTRQALRTEEWPSPWKPLMNAEGTTGFGRHRGSREDAHKWTRTSLFARTTPRHVRRPQAAGYSK